MSFGMDLYYIVSIIFDATVIKIKSVQEANLHKNA